MKINGLDFPLGGTSTMYMSGKGVYQLRRFGIPGIITSIELLPGDAALFEDQVRAAMEAAWDIGLLVGQDPYGFDKTANPYRRELKDFEVGK